MSLLVYAPLYLLLFVAATKAACDGNDREGNLWRDECCEGKPLKYLGKLKQSMSFTIDRLELLWYK